MLINRRMLLASACATAACNPTGFDAAMRRTGSLIDVHTHVFNASDLSVEKFVSVVVCKNYSEASSVCGPGEAYGPALGKVIKAVADAFAPSARKEYSRLVGNNDEGLPEEGEVDFDLADDPTRDTEADDKFKDAVAAQLESMARDASDDPLSSDRQLLDQIAVEAEARNQSGDLGVMDERRQVEEVMAEPAPDANPQIRRGDIVGRYLRWAKWLCRSRNRIINRYKEIYASPSKFVGLLVDYELWLADEPESKFADQMRVMAKLRETHSELLSFAPFDPLRQAFAVKRNQAGEKTPLDDLMCRWNPQPNCACGTTPPASGEYCPSGQRLIDGVKLYPPMGFRPIDNVGLTDREFPAHIVQRWRQLGGMPNTLGAALDSALVAFYDWAEREQVPVMTHSGNSVDAGCGFAARGSPEQWLKVFSPTARLSNGQAGPQKRNLRLCLGHFTDGLDKFIGNDATSWGWQKSQLLAFPNVYTDLSYTEEIVNPDNADQVHRFFGALKRFSEGNDGLNASKILYGSDWIMFDREANSGAYFARIREEFEANNFPNGALARFSSENARQFLNLS